MITWQCMLKEKYFVEADVKTDKFTTNGSMYIGYLNLFVKICHNER